MSGQSKCFSSGVFVRQYDFAYDLLWKSLLLLVCFSACLRAQVGMATLSGTVTDPTGLAVPNVQVTLQSATENASRETVTNTGGQYVIPAIPPGTYRLVMKANGFQSQTFTGIGLTSGQGSTP